MQKTPLSNEFSDASHFRTKWASQGKIIIRHTVMLYSLSQKRDNDCFEHLQSRENFAIAHCKARLFKSTIDPQCLKIIENVSFNIASEASYFYTFSGQKLIKNAKN